jgi:putative ATP-dependent endonuclease of the OLD family
MGLDFVGVGGYGYLPFLRFAESLNIPWLIFSDAENITKNRVRKQFAKCGSQKKETDCIVFLDDGDDFEQQLIKGGFSDEIKKAIASFDVYENDKHREAKESDRLAEIESYDDDQLYNIITADKTQYGPVIAEHIIKNNKSLPPKISALFDKIADILKIKEVKV